MLDKLSQAEAAPPWSFFRALGMFVGMFALLITGTTIAQIVVGDSQSAIMTGWSIGMILTILFVGVMFRQTDEQVDALRISAAPRNLPIILLLGFGVAVMFDLLSWVAAGNQTLAAAELLTFTRNTVNTGGWLIALLFMVLLQPIAEELVFRGVMFPALRAALGAWTGLVFCAGFYAVFHFVAYAPSPENQRVLLWYGLMLPFLDGLFISVVRATTGSTRAAMVAHAALGLFAVLKVYTFAG